MSMFISRTETSRMKGDRHFLHLAFTRPKKNYTIISNIVMYMHSTVYTPNCRKRKYIVLENEILQTMWCIIQYLVHDMVHDMVHVSVPSVISMVYLNTCAINMQVLQSAFDRLHIEKHIDVQRLIRGKYMDNLEFMQVGY